MKKNILLSSTALLVAAGFATPTFAQFTISAGVQSTNMNVESEMNVSFISGTIITETSASSNNQETAVSGELAGGYQFNFNPTYNVALEVFAQQLNNSVNVPIFVDESDRISGNTAKTSFDWIAGLRLRPGYNITPSTRVFVDGGVVWGGMEIDYDDDNGLGLGGQEDAETLSGWRYGAGFEHAFLYNFMIGVDYTVTQFSEMHAEKAEQAFHEQKNGSGSTSFEDSATLKTLGLNFKYLFGAQKPARHYEMRDK